MMKIADPTFGLDRYAWTLLALLSTFEPNFAEFNDAAMMYEVRLQTDPHRGAGKNWAAITMAPAMAGTGPRKTIAFGRSAYQDEIVVQSWELMSGTEACETPSTLHRFKPDELVKAAEFVRDELGRAYVEARAQACGTSRA